MCLPSAMTMKLASSPCRNSSTTTSRPASPNWPANIDGHRGECLLDSGSDHDALAGGKSARLDDERRALQRAPSRHRSSPRVKVAERAVGMRCRRRNSLAKALEPSSCAGARCGPKQASPRAANASTMPSTSGPSGPMIVSATRSALASCTSAAMSSRGDGDVAHLRFERGAGVAGRHEHLGDARGAGAFPGERVLAAAAADDQNLHQCRKWRTPVNTMAIACSSAAAMTSASRLLPPGWMTARMP